MTRGSEHAERSLQSIQELVIRVHTVDTRPFEKAEIAELSAELIPTCRRLLVETTDLCEEIFGRYRDQVGKNTGLRVQGQADFGQSIDFLMENRTAAQRIIDIARAARHELSQRHRSLATTATETERWEVLALCDGVCRWVLKSVSAMEVAICEHEGLESGGCRYITETERALRVRRAYAEYRQALQPDTPPAEETVYERIRGAGVAMAALSAHSSYTEMRTRDRFMLRKLQSRILRWLRHYNGTERTTRTWSGLRLWQDAVGLATLMLQISNRPELCTYDLGVLLVAHTVLFDRACDEVEPELFEKLETLYGLDLAIDRCIEEGPGCPAAKWRRVLAPALKKRRATTSAIPCPRPDEDTPLSAITHDSQRYLDLGGYLM